VKEKALGKLLLMEANLSHDLFRKLAPSSWRLSSTHAPAGLMTALGIHLTDLFVHLAGEAQDVHAWTGRMVLDPPAEDFMTASIAFASGVRASITSLSVTPFYSRVTFYGDQGWVEVAAEANVDQGKPTLLTHASGSERRSATFEATDTVTENFEAWADAVEGRAPYRFSDQELIGNIKILEAIVTSSRENGAAQRL
jgi:predicted dehydrogenase